MLDVQIIARDASVCVKRVFEDISKCFGLREKRIDIRSLRNMSIMVKRLPEYGTHVVRKVSKWTFQEVIAREHSCNVADGSLEQTDLLTRLREVNRRDVL